MDTDSHLWAFLFAQLDGCPADLWHSLMYLRDMRARIVATPTRHRIDRGCVLAGIYDAVKADVLVRYAEQIAEAMGKLRE